MRRLDLKLSSDPAELKPARHAVEAFAKSCGFSDNAIGDIGLCLNEAMANVIRHAYGGAVDRPMEIHADFDGNLLKLSLRDWGNRQVPSLNPKPHDPLMPGGLGLICLRTMMDEVDFEPQPDGMLLTLQRRVSRK